MSVSTAVLPMHKTAFIIHGKIRKAGSLQREIAEMFGAGDSPRILVTSKAHESESLARQALKEGTRTLIAIGGDGTLHEVVNGVMKARESMPLEDWQSIRIGVLPRGTGNDFAKSHPCPQTVAQLKTMLETGEIQQVDAGLLSSIHPDGTQQSRYFINIADLGLGGTIAEKLTTMSRWAGKTLTYQWAILTTLFRFRPQPVRVSTEQFTYPGKILNLVIANGRYFGSGLCIAPMAQLADGQFTLVIIGEISTLDYLKNFRRLRTCQRIDHPEVYYHTCRKVTVEADGTRISAEMDGEFAGYAPISAEVIPGALSFLAMPVN